MKSILIDADGCPVVDLTLKIAAKRGVCVTILCDTSHLIERKGAKTVTVDKGADSVDFVLVNMVRKGDVVITQDYALAAMCLARGADVLSQNGLIYSHDNIDSLLQSRYIAKKIRRAGGRLKGPRARTGQQDCEFEKALIKILDKNE